MDNIKSLEEFRDLTQGEKPFCAIFSAQWCPDCRIIKPFLPELETLYSEQYIFAIVDRDEFMDLSREFDIIGIPSFIVFHRGNAVAHFISQYGKTRKEITDFLNQAILDIPRAP